MCNIALSRPRYQMIRSFHSQLSCVLYEITNENSLVVTQTFLSHSQDIWASHILPHKTLSIIVCVPVTSYTVVSFPATDKKHFHESIQMGILSSVCVSRLSSRVLMIKVTTFDRFSSLLTFDENRCVSREEHPICFLLFLYLKENIIMCNNKCIIYRHLQSEME